MGVPRHRRALYPPDIITLPVRVPFANPTGTKKSVYTLAEERGSRA